MPASPVKRRLAAILAADVAGYSRMVAEDEEATLRTLGASRAAIGDLTAEHGGRIFGTAGDSVIAEFASAVQAVRAAVAIQRALQGRNADLSPGRRLEFRIGINLGDVVVEGEDLLGDGVNIAARLQEVAAPAGICLSGAVRDQIEGKLTFPLASLGERWLKNIPRPVPVYQVEWDPDAPAATTVLGGGTLALPDKPSIAVLPFDNLSGDPGERYFSDGITEDIITDLSRFRSLFIIARNSSFQFRDRATDVRRIARELGVQYVVEGSVRKGEGRLRITAQLIDATTGNHLWAERYDRSLEDIFTVQDAVVRTIAGTLVGRLEAAGAERARRKPPTSLVAYDYVLRGKALPLGDLQSDAEKRRMYQKAVELDPNYALAHALLALSVFLEWFRDMAGSDVVLGRAVGLAKKAVTLDENDSTCQSVLGWMYLFYKSFDLAEEYYRRALELNPTDPEQIARMSFLYACRGRPDEAVNCLKQARLIDPYFNPTWYWHHLGYSHFIARRYEEAIVAFNRSSTMPFWVQAYLAACHGLTDRVDLAWEFACEVLRLAPDFSSARLAAKEPFERPADREHLIEGMRKAGLPE